MSKEALVHRLRNFALPAAVALWAVVSPCPAQDPAAPAVQPPIDDTDLTFSISAGYQYIFRRSASCQRYRTTGNSGSTGDCYSTIDRSSRVSLTKIQRGAGAHRAC